MQEFPGTIYDGCKALAQGRHAYVGASDLERNLLRISTILPMATRSVYDLVAG